MDTAWIGRLGAPALAGAAVGISIFNTFSKLLNNPLLSVTTSLIARAKGQHEGCAIDAEIDPEDLKGIEPSQVICIGSAGSAAILLAVLSGLLQTLLMVPFGGFLLSAAGIPAGSPLWEGAYDMLIIKGTGAAITSALLVSQGIFRGVGDTQAPLAGTVLTNVINLLLDPLLVFGLAWGTSGAAVATVIAQGVGFLYLARILERRGALKLDPGVLREAVSSILAFLKPTGFLVLRTLATMSTFLVASTLAAGCGEALGACHQILFQLWLATALLADAVAIASQSLLGQALGIQAHGRAEALVHKSLGLGLALGVATGALLLAAAPAIPGLFSSEPLVQMLVQGYLPVIALTQPLSALAFVSDGLIYGAGGFKTAAKLMPFCAGPAIALMVAGCKGPFAQDPGMRLWAVWAGLSLFMLLRAASIYGMFLARRGPFKSIPGSAKPGPAMAAAPAAAS